MSQWVIKGLGTAVKTTRYPYKKETAAGVSPGLPAGGPSALLRAGGGDELIARCPRGALRAADGCVVVDSRRCIHCFRCVRETATTSDWREGYEWAGVAPGARLEPLGSAFSRSIHLLVMDAGDCGACLHEAKQLNNPYYNMHRLGFFMTPTPRHADVLLVVGCGVDHLRATLEKTYRAMPTPKRVVAAGACSLTGSVFGPSFVTGRGVADIIPVDVEVPGHPPPPLAILHGLLVAVGRRPPASLILPAGPEVGS
jgi:Ni,Fe-hydrogenase III small subunit